jgi:predicted nuclease of restriction endonuclease-like (RecB) superfamily
MKKKIAKSKSIKRVARVEYDDLLIGVVGLLEAGRRTAARSVNTLMTATYWEIGRRIVEHEQAGETRAEYGEEVLKRLAGDLTRRFGRGFSRRNVQQMRAFYIAFTPDKIWQTVSAKSQGEAQRSAPYDEAARLDHKNQATASLKSSANPTAQIRSTLSNKSSASVLRTAPDKSDSVVQNLFGASIWRTPSAKFTLSELARAFPLPWSHYVLLINRSRSPEAIDFYHTEALRGGWSVRQLARQIDSQFYERTALSRGKAAMLTRGAQPKPEDAVSADEEIKDPLVLEFLGLRDEYSETDLEDALIRHLESFLLELGNDFAFVGRQRRLRIDDEWYRVDLLFFHRRLRCLVVIDLKLGRFTHADAGQMHLYLNYALEHWVQPGENPPVGIILCAGKGEALVRYATEGLPNKMLVREYLTALPDEKVLAAEIDKTRRRLEGGR